MSLSDEVEKALREYIGKVYHGKKGGFSIAIEESIRRFLEEESKGKRRLT